MKIYSLLIASVLVTAPSVQSFADDQGPTLFKTICATCHTIGKGKLVGPDLKGVGDRHPETWLIKWIKGSQAMVKAGDADAVKLFKDNSMIPMPDQALSDDQIKSLLAYIKTEGSEEEAAAPAAAPPASGVDQVTIATQKAAADQSKESGGLLTMFSFTEYILMFLMIIMLIIIWVLSTAIKSLAEKRVEDALKQKA